MSRDPQKSGSLFSVSMGDMLALNGLLLIYSVSNLLSKLAAGQDLLSTGFFLCYGGMLLLLAVYALGWQQIIRRVPLTTAYANKAVTVVWGILFGMLFFGEGLSAGRGLGALLIIAGVVLFSLEDGSAAAPKDGGEATP